MTMLPTLNVVIPALNEVDNVGPLVADIRRVGATLEGVSFTGVILVDNGSTDGTGEAARAAGATVHAERKRGYGHAMWSGVMVASNAQVLLFMDADRGEVPEEIPLVLGPLLRGEADLVLGSRVRSRSESGALTIPQRFGNQVAGWCIRLLFGVRVTDLGPFRAISRHHLVGLEMREMTYGWPTEMVAKAAKSGLRIVEVPVTSRKRTAGESKVSGNFRASMSTAQRIFAVIWRVWRTPASAQ